jgi:hypothetical protein
MVTPPALITKLACSIAINSGSMFFVADLACIELKKRTKINSFFMVNFVS